MKDCVSGGQEGFCISVIYALHRFVSEFLGSSQFSMSYKTSEKSTKFITVLLMFLLIFLSKNIKNRIPLYKDRYHGTCSRPSLARRQARFISVSGSSAGHWSTSDLAPARSSSPYLTTNTLFLWSLVPDPLLVDRIKESKTGKICDEGKDDIKMRMFKGATVHSYGGKSIFSEPNTTLK